MIIANEQPREDVRLRSGSGSLIEANRAVRGCSRGIKNLKSM